MSGHRRPGDAEHDELEVDDTLEGDIGAVVRAVDAYLAAPADDRRHELLTALEQLDDQLEAGDAFSGRWLRGVLPDPDVVGETSTHPIADDVQQGEFHAQVVLVKAAKHEVTAPTPETLAALRDARVALDTVRAQEGVDHPPTPRTA